MELKITRDAIYNLFVEMSTSEIIDYLEDQGLRFVGLPNAPRGIYRREEGTDLIYTDGHGNWTRVDWSGHDEKKIVWACFDYDKGDWWVRVLDEDLCPVSLSYDDEYRVLFDMDGNRIH